MPYDYGMGAPALEIGQLRLAIPLGTKSKNAARNWTAF
jgi:hypothetical protein